MHLQGRSHCVVAGHSTKELLTDLATLEETEKYLLSQQQTIALSLAETRLRLSLRRARIRETQNSPALVYRLPDELLLFIFELAVYTQSPGGGPRIETILSRVSSYWRNMFLRTPLLWARISVTPSIRTKDIDVHLKRSGARALDIEFVGWRDIPDSFHRPQHFDYILNSLLVSAHRWRSIYISDMCDALLTCLNHALYDYPSFKLPVLKAIVFRPQHFNQQFSLSCLLSRSLETMDVENLSLPAVLLKSYPNMLSTTILTHLTLRARATEPIRTAIDLSVFRLLISGAPNLRHLALYGQPISTVNQNSADVNMALEFPCLSTLVLQPGTLKPGYLRDFINAAKAPNLRRFELMFPDHEVHGQDISDLLFEPQSARPKFPCISVASLQNVASTNTSAGFAIAFQATTHLRLSGSDASTVLVDQSAGISGPHQACQEVSWSNLQELTLVDPSPATMRHVHAWARARKDNAQTVPLVIIQDLIHHFPSFPSLCNTLREFARVTLVDIDMGVFEEGSVAQCEC
ncbi:hypothetical protein BDN67DRAFT_588258 [Paxillus ammoniavirescens]|nr:hypothetical protein BDN67DRAFT_588258 [Paxillus ammoniavirescens]